jgi:hypothetical protein
MLNLVIKVKKQNHRILLFLLATFFYHNWKSSKIYVCVIFFSFTALSAMQS